MNVEIRQTNIATEEVAGVSSPRRRGLASDLLISTQTTN